MARFALTGGCVSEGVCGGADSFCHPVLNLHFVYRELYLNVAAKLAHKNSCGFAVTVLMLDSARIPPYKMGNILQPLSFKIV